MRDAGWQELYILTGHWQSDMKFFQDEIRFLVNLVNKYFMFLIEDENIMKVQTVAGKLSRIDEQRSVLERKIIIHLHRLKELMEDSSTGNEDTFRNEHIALEDEIADLTKSFRETKKAVFELTENVIQSEKIKHLLER